MGGVAAAGRGLFWASAARVAGPSDLQLEIVAVVVPGVRDEEAGRVLRERVPAACRSAEGVRGDQSREQRLHPRGSDAGSSFDLLDAERMSWRGGDGVEYAQLECREERLRRHEPVGHCVDVNVGRRVTRCGRQSTARRVDAGARGDAERAASRRYGCGAQRGCH
eukprot:scaffold14109_cov56-Isochrysis_galbana.AAC.1